MSTSGNRNWAFMEATRRASTMKDAYSIYRHRNGEDYIIRTAVAAPPLAASWQRVSTIESDGSQSFTARSD